MTIELVLDIFALGDLSTRAGCEWSPWSPLFCITDARVEIRELAPWVDVRHEVGAVRWVSTPTCDDDLLLLQLIDGSNGKIELTQQLPLLNIRRNP